METIARFLVVAETDRNPDYSPGLPTAPSQYHVELAADIGAALQLPSAAERIGLEQCNLNDFVLWRGTWECFAIRTREWAEARLKSRVHRLKSRVHRLALLDPPRGEDPEMVEQIRPAFSLPLMGGFGFKRGQIGGYIHGRKDIVSLLDLRSGPVDETEHYRIVYAAPTLTLPELIATYLRKYWEVLGP